MGPGHDGGGAMAHTSDTRQLMVVMKMEVGSLVEEGGEGGGEEVRHRKVGEGEALLGITN